MTATPTEVRRCKICHRRLTPERELEELKTCSRRCTRRWRRWQDPLETRLAQLLAAAGEDRLLWNNEALQEKLGLDRQATGERLLQLARSRHWEVAWDRRGFVRAIAPVPVERRKYLVQREVIPGGAPLTPREQLLGALAPELVDAFEAFVVDVVKRELAEPERLLVPVSEFATRVGLSPASVYRHIALGQIEAVRIGGRVLVRGDEVERLNGTQTPKESVPNGRDQLK